MRVGSEVFSVVFGAEAFAEVEFSREEASALLGEPVAERGAFLEACFLFLCESACIYAQSLGVVLYAEPLFPEDGGDSADFFVQRSRCLEWVQFSSVESFECFVACHFIETRQNDRR